MDRLADTLVDLASDLISVRTENPPGRGYPECIETVAAWLRRLGLPAELAELGPQRYAVISGTGSGPVLYLHGHYDVVPQSVAGQFDPRVEGGRLVGRGSADMKGAVACMIVALAVLAEQELPGRVELVLVPDEETGGAEGSQRLLELGRLGRDGVGAILGEPTSGRIWNANRGALTLRIKVRGRPAHVGLHYLGANAFEGAIPILRALQDLKAQVETHRTSFALGPPEARNSILMLGGEVDGAHQFNVVPDRFAFTLERRFNPEEDLEEERSRIMDAITVATPSDVDVSIEVIQAGESALLQEDHVLIRALDGAIHQVTGGPAECTLCPGLLESRFYAEAGVPAVAYGPGELELAHGPDESVELTRLQECAKIYALTSREFFLEMDAR